MTEVNNTNREKLENIFIRFVYMVVFFIAHRLSSIVLAFIAVIQFVLVLFKGEKNDHLLGFAGSLNKYIYQTGIFLSFESEDKPFPFNSWPEQSQGTTNDEIDTSSDTLETEASKDDTAGSEAPEAKKAPAKRKPAAKKVPAKSTGTKTTTAAKRKPRASTKKSTVASDAPKTSPDNEPAGE